MTLQVGSIYTRGSQLREFAKCALSNSPIQFPLASRGGRLAHLLAGIHLVDSSQRARTNRNSIGYKHGNENTRRECRRKRGARIRRDPFPVQADFTAPNLLST